MIFLNKAKNYIANGALDFWQRGSTFTAIATSTYFADRFLYQKSGAVVHTITRDTDVPTLTQSKFTFPYSAVLTTTTLMTAGSTDYCAISQRIEGQVFSPLAGRSLTVTFWVKSSITGVYAVAFRNGSLNRSYVSTYTVNAANTWEKKSITLSHNITGTWTYTTATGLEVLFPLCSGSSLQAPSLNNWYDGNFISHSTCVNAVSTIGQVFKITGIQLEEGTEASNFERMGYIISNELSICQRYYEKSYQIDTAPATNTNNGKVIAHVGDSTFLPGFRFSQAKRTLPTITIYSGTGILGSVTRFVGGANIAVATLTTDLSETCVGYLSGTVLVNGATYTYHYTADAEL